MAFDRGYSSPLFRHDADRQVCDYENALLLVTDRKISAIADLLPVLEMVAKAGSSPPGDPGRGGRRWKPWPPWW